LVEEWKDVEVPIAVIEENFWVRLARDLLIPDQCDWVVYSDVHAMGRSRDLGEVDGVPFRVLRDRIPNDGFERIGLIINREPFVIGRWRKRIGRGLIICCDVHQILGLLKLFRKRGLFVRDFACEDVYSLPCGALAKVREVLSLHDVSGVSELLSDDFGTVQLEASSPVYPSPLHLLFTECLVTRPKRKLFLLKAVVDCRLLVAEGPVPIAEHDVGFVGEVELASLLAGRDIELPAVLCESIPLERNLRRLIGSHPAVVVPSRRTSRGA
jgi:hypothetical protein